MNKRVKLGEFHESPMKRVDERGTGFHSGTP